MPNYNAMYPWNNSAYGMQSGGYGTYNAYQPPMPVPSGNNMPAVRIAVDWVDGELEARGRSIPQGVSQYYLFDAGQPKIYLKSINPMGMPNPMQVLNYTVEEATAALPAGVSGNAESMPDMSRYVTKDDLEEIRNEMKAMAVNMNQHGSNQNGIVQNRGGNRNG